MLYFENLYVSNEVKDLPLAIEIESKISFKNKHFVDGENHAGNGILLANNKGRFIKPCPGQKGSVCCNYWVVEWGLGCPFKCEYCILQNYAKAGDVTLFLNFEDCKKELIELRKNLKGTLRIGTGQFGDPLGLEDIFPLNREMIKWTENMPDTTLEIKSKSDDISVMLEADVASHVTLAFSLNPQEIIEAFEHGAASLKNRLSAAVKAANSKKCDLAFHFDPIIPVVDWKRKYAEVFDLMHEMIGDLRVKWISLGTFRFPIGFQEYVEKYHPNTCIFLEEYHHSFDGKLRYFRPFREEIYKFAIDNLKQYFPDTSIYMCMESSDVWERVAGKRFKTPDLKAYLDKQV